MRRQPMNNDADLNMLACFLVYHSIPSLKNMVASDLEGTINCWFIQRTSMNVELLVQWNTRWSSKGNTNSIPLPISVCSSHNATLWLQKYTARVIWTTLKVPIYFKRTGVTYLYYIYIYAFSRCFYPKRLTIAFRLYIFISTCLPWESNPQAFALLTQCSTTEPHRNTISSASRNNWIIPWSFWSFQALQAWWNQNETNRTNHCRLGVWKNLSLNG